MGICGCLCGDADAYDLSMPDWMVWSDHPVRKQFDVVMDLGEGSFAKVTLRIVSICSESIQVKCSYQPRFASHQVVLGRQKDNHQKFAALKVVFLGNPELDADHLEIIRQWVPPCKLYCT